MRVEYAEKVKHKQDKQHPELNKLLTKKEDQRRRYSNLAVEVKE